MNNKINLSINKNFDLPMLDGRRFSLNSFRQSAATLLVFYKYSCPTCSYMLPIINDFYLKNSGRNECIIFISQDSMSDTKAFAEKMNFKVPVAIDAPDYTLSRSIDFFAVPASFLVDSDGNIIQVSEGFVRDDLISFTHALQDLNKFEVENLFKDPAAIPGLKPG